MALKRTAPEVLSIELGPVRMWRDDASELVKLLSQCCDKPPKLTADDYELDDVDEDFDALLKQGLKEIAQFTLVGDDGRVRLQLGATNTVEITTPTLRDKGALGEASKIIRRCRRFEFGAAVVTLLGASIISVLRFRFPGLGTPLLRWETETVIYTSTRAQSPTFWQRKRDDVWINAVSLAMGGVIGYFVNEMTG
ncbi:hypothetical protein OG992_02240 [Micromonospora sp. NBC_00362]|uniref:hypothetical protein n=1 Tax=Micromonospora sp. NBC_00362 TaxID=2975975 RepID=UPI0022583E9D|nr:hypothetical protein [Micromonospora sp. NBC_00362]MCX5115979.1 hypothetical protein [Micromonospora sp. NBC_00362]